MNTSRIVLIEFNELSPYLLDKWVADGHLPNFRRLYERSAVFVTQADELVAPNLEPWIQWYSLHTGIEFQRHRVFRLTDGPRAQHDDIWRVLLRHGKRVGNLSSMNARGFSDEEGSFFFPDPWCTSERAYPNELNIFHRFVAQHVQEYSNPNSHFTPKDYATFLKFLLQHGLRAKTIRAILTQLFAERTKGRKEEVWKRAALLDAMQFDVFKHYFDKCRPDFATFFANSTAHYQHAYWRCMEPEAFSIKPTAEEIRLYGDAVLFGYKRMDALLRDFFELEREGVSLVLATGLSQQPFLRGEAEGGLNFYRLRNPARLLSELGITFESVEPVMTQQYMVRFGAATGRAEEAAIRLATLRLEGKLLFEIDKRADNTLYFGCQLHHFVGDDAIVDSGTQRLRFYELLYRIDAVKSGGHHPDGALWIQHEKHRVFAEKVSILDIFPTLLEMLGVPRSAERIRPGRSLLSSIESPS